MMFWSKDNNSDKPANLNTTEAPVSEALILICEKCGKKLSSDPEKNPARALQLRLKERIRADGDKGKIRAVVSSCLDICPDGEIAVAIARTQTANEFLKLSGAFDERACEEILRTTKKPT